jgi:hypothetical protein
MASEHDDAVQTKDKQRTPTRTFASQVFAKLKCVIEYLVVSILSKCAFENGAKHKFRS